MSGRPTGGYSVSLSPEVASVVSARSIAHEAAKQWRLNDDATEDLALVTSELVTNAVLHAQTAIEVRMDRLGSGVRVQVLDGNRRLPHLDVRRVENSLATRSMTGRGLGVVAILSDRWGAEPVPEGGKVVWAEVCTERRASMLRSSRPGRRRASPAPGGPRAVAELRRMVSSAADPPVATGAVAQPRHGATVHLIDVPVRILLDSERQHADLQREMVVVEMDPEGGGPNRVSPTAARRMSAALRWFRRMGAQEARRARDRGQDLVSFDVVVPDDLRGEIEQSSGPLMVLSRMMEEGQLLTLPPSPEVARFRRWCEAEVAAQLGGGSPSPYPR